MNRCWTSGTSSLYSLQNQQIHMHNTSIMALHKQLCAFGCNPSTCRHDVLFLQISLVGYPCLAGLIAGAVPLVQEMFCASFGWPVCWGTNNSCMKASCNMPVLLPGSIEPCASRQTSFILQEPGTS
eukprot:GHUV01030482.1.p1 GENE.GHUV01030482.1~~GHUV01030482.1.p1  ORF type:complete len:126 (+),score=14.19 GHUV01030482.1:527-904(+)